MESFDPVRALGAYLTGEWVENLRESTLPLSEKGVDQWDEKSRALEKLKQEVVVCKACTLYQQAKQAVFADGTPYTPLVFVGEAPGEEEDNQGLPFVGRAGKLLTETLSKFGVSRSEVYICNILKHRPPGNRTPTEEETIACTPFLRKQLEIIQPKLIVALGNSAAKYLLSTEEGITRTRGREHKSILDFPVFPTFHPAAVLRNYPAYYPLFEADIHQALMRVGLCRK
ncbi:uracil-DNA glycosylase [Thermospira aquatica]|uniref:Type-4 uracil-DNA glycosylase n=1 Tax=Thermospira aquatica TaxID=2828656 RepID=A0AAX3BE74_9SPIR|nr:uracil-DNA glycosylase [Thermospira aquatica]URA10420.1 uracil-DNA glycosylase [Thermospira aquatica]